MGFFDLFKKPTIVNDDFFGTLRFVASKNPSKAYFEGKGHFAPTNSETEYLIQADENGPTDEQKQFYRDLQANFNQYVEKIKPLIEDEFRRMSSVVGKTTFQSKTFRRNLNLYVSPFPGLTADH